VGGPHGSPQQSEEVGPMPEKETKKEIKKEHGKKGEK
jgi:hypothetical protein